MCAMKKEDFLDLAPGYVGDILYEHLHLLQTDATLNGESDTRTTTPENLDIPKNLKLSSTQNNNSKLSQVLSNGQMTENNNPNENSFQSDSSQVSPQQHVPYPYHQVSPSLASDGATAAAAMAVAAQHHVLYNYGAGSVGTGYPQGNVGAGGGYDSYHQFYAAAMAATAMAAARSYGEGQSSTYGYPPSISPTSGRDSQYSHHPHHSPLQYNPLSFPPTRGSSAHGGGNNRSLSSPSSQPYHSSFAVSFNIIFLKFEL